MVRCDRPGLRPWVFLCPQAARFRAAPDWTGTVCWLNFPAGWRRSCRKRLDHAVDPSTQKPMSNPPSPLHPGARVRHSAFGEGTVLEASPAFVKTYFDDLDKSKQLPRSGESMPDGLELLEAGAGPEGLQPEEVEDLVWRVMERYVGGVERIPMGERWNGGTMILKPSDPDLAPKELPLETFFHKIVMLRDRLRVLEQQINGHAKLDDEDKVHLQQYITRSYGSLTSFNTLFKLKADHFKGAGKGS